MKNHKAAAKKLDIIIKKAFGLIFNNTGKISEYDVSQFILEEFLKEDLAVDKKFPAPIVAFGKNTQHVHFYPERKSRKIEKGDLIMLDIWAKSKKGGRFADITWMGFAGKRMSGDYKKIYEAVIGARNEAIRFIRRCLKNKVMPKSGAVDSVARGYFKKRGLEEYFLHGIGHSLGETSCHGDDFKLAPSGDMAIAPEIPFTIEPGIYIKNKFGFRSEIDCYIDKSYKLILTSGVQKKIVNPRGGLTF